MATDRQLQKLRRDELLEILLEVEQENEQLNKQNLELRDRLSNREFAIKRAGSLADASVQLSGVLLAAQDAADMYVQNVRTLCVEFARKTEELCGDKGTVANGVESGSLVSEVVGLFDELVLDVAPHMASNAVVASNRRSDASTS